MNRHIQTAGLLGALVIAVAGCTQRQPEPAATTGPDSAAAEAQPAAAPDRREADDPEAGLNTTRPDSPKDIKPEPGTPAVP